MHQVWPIEKDKPLCNDFAKYCKDLIIAALHYYWRQSRFPSILCKLFSFVQFPLYQRTDVIN